MDQIANQSGTPSALNHKFLGSDKKYWDILDLVWDNNNNNNTIWDEGQLGAVEGVLGTVGQLIINRCIMEEVKQYHRNLAVAFYDYKKA